MSVYRPPPLRGRGRARTREGNSPDINSPGRVTNSAGRNRHPWDQDNFSREKRNTELDSHSYNGSRCLDERSSGRGISLKVIETTVGRNVERNGGQQRTGTSQSPDQSVDASRQESPNIGQKSANTRLSARNRPRRPDVQVYVPRGRRSRGSKGVPCRTVTPSGPADPVQSFLQDNVPFESQSVCSDELPLKNVTRESHTWNQGTKFQSDSTTSPCLQTESHDTSMTNELVSSHRTNRDISEACSTPVISQDIPSLDSSGIERTRNETGEINLGSYSSIHEESSQNIDNTCVTETLYKGYNEAAVEKEEEYSSQCKNSLDHLNDREGRSEGHDDRDPLIAITADDDGDHAAEYSRRVESDNIVSYSEMCASIETTISVQETNNVLRTEIDGNIQTDTAEEASGDVESHRNDTTENLDVQMTDNVPGEPCVADLNEELHTTGCNVSDPDTAVGVLETYKHEEGVDNDSLDALTKATVVESCTDNSMSDYQYEDQTKPTLTVSKEEEEEERVDTHDQLDSSPAVVQSDIDMTCEDSDNEHDGLEMKSQEPLSQVEEINVFDHVSEEIENSDKRPAQGEMFDNEVEQNDETKEDIKLEAEEMCDETYRDSRQQELIRLEDDEISTGSFAAHISTRPDTMSSDEEGPDSDSWDAMFDDDGECLDPSAMQELASIVGKVKIQKTKKIDYLAFQPKDKTADIDYSSYGHVIEIYEFPSEFVTRDLITAFQAYMSRGFDLKWVDDTHALGIFDSPIAAQDALSMIHPLLKVCSLQHASKQSKAKARRCVEFLQPYKERPKTSASAARRLVAGALGIQTNVPRETREKERQLLKEAKAKKRQDRKNKEDIWEFGRCAMDEES